MKFYTTLIVSTGIFFAGALPAHAQFGDFLKKAQEAIEDVVEEVAPIDDSTPATKDDLQGQDNVVSENCPEPSPNYFPSCWRAQQEDLDAAEEAYRAKWEEEARVEKEAEAERERQRLAENCPEPSRGYFPRCWRMQQEDLDAAEEAYRAKWEEEARVEKEAEAERERQRLAANQELLSTVDANSDCAALFNDSSFKDQCWSLKSAANREQYEVAKKERLEKEREKEKREEEERQRKFDEHIATLTLISQGEVVEILGSGLPGRLRDSNEIGWEISFITEIKGVRSDASYKFKGVMTCSDDWGDKVGNRTEVEGTVVFDDTGAMDLGFNMNFEPMAGTWVMVTLSQLDMGVQSTDMKKVDSCAFTRVKIKNA